MWSGRPLDALAAYTSAGIDMLKEISDLGPGVSPIGAVLATKDMADSALRAANGIAAGTVDGSAVAAEVAKGLVPGYTKIQEGNELVDQNMRLGASIRYTEAIGQVVMFAYSIRYWPTMFRQALVRAFPAPVPVSGTPLNAPLTGTTLKGSARGLAVNAAELIKDSNPKAPLTPTTAASVLESGPAGTVPIVAGPGGQGADVRFVNPRTLSVVSSTETKSMSGKSQSSFNSAMSDAARQVGAGPGTIAIQLSPGFDPCRAMARWMGGLRQAAAADPTKLAPYIGKNVVLYDSAGTAIPQGVPFPGQ